MKHRFFQGVVLGAVVSSVVLASTAAFAGTGIGGIFNLGQKNGVNATSTLSGATAGRQLQVTNTSTGSGATGVGIKVAPGVPPLRVNSTTQVPNLDASLLGGRSATGFVQGTGTATQTGFIAVGPGSAVDLGPIPNIGELWGDCANTNATGAAIRLETNTTLGPFFFESPSVGETSGGHDRLPVLSDTEDGIATVQISTAGRTATITGSAHTFLPQECDFSVQTLSSSS